MIVPCARCASDVTVDAGLEDAAVEVLCDRCTTRRDAEQLARRRASVGAPLTDWTFDSIDQATGIEHGIKLARAWAAGDVDRVGLVGPVGTGKTRVAIAAAHAMIGATTMTMSVVGRKRRPASSGEKPRTSCM